MDIVLSLFILSLYLPLKADLDEAKKQLEDAKQRLKDEREIQESKMWNPAGRLCFLIFEWILI